jgi:glycosyltransferase involved in cell wall biosynthesis/Flp pilus assembly protein TadD
VALKIVRASQDERLQTPLRAWYGGQHDEAVTLLATADGGRHADEATQVVAAALATEPARAAALGAALVLWSDDASAYRILRRSIESLIDETGRLTPARWAPRGMALLALVRPWLDAHPAEPVLLNYVGVALYGLNEPSLALGLLQAAQAIDPSVENISGNLTAVRHRLRNPVALSLGPRESGQLKAHRAFFKALGGRARAASNEVRLSLCMIVRDEEEMLPECLASCAAGVDEMIIVDTGSTDRTVEIAESFGATVLHFPWNGSFSDARNHGIDAATGTHILWLDADERLEDGDAEQLHRLAGQPYREAHWLVETNFTGQEEVGTAATHLALRVWRNRKQYRFSGAIHEQIRVSMPTDLGERFAVSSLRIRHYGYLKSRIDERDKHQRNLTLLLKELAQSPNNAFTHFNLGTEYLGTQELDRAATHLEESYRLLQRDEGWYEYAYASLLATRLIGVRRVRGDLDGADLLAAQLLQVYPAFTDLVFERGLIARERGNRLQAIEHFETCLEMGDAPARFAGMVGRGTFLALAALATTALELEDAPRAIGYLERSLTEHPSYLPAGLDLTDALLVAPDVDPDAVLARMEAAGNTAATWWLFLGTAFYERGHATIAETLFRRALAKAPTNPAASIGLVETLLTQHRYAEAATSAPDLPVATPFYLAVERARILALALTGETAEAVTAAERFAAGGADPAEAAFLASLAPTLSGASGDVLPGPAVAPYALRMLDSLARLEEYDAFERLVPVATGAIGDRRVAAVALAELYLARGFYQLAGEQAIVAIEIGGPEARALAALGKAAVAEGLFDDALPVLEASLDLDPSQTPVRTLLETLRTRIAA